MREYARKNYEQNRERWIADAIDATHRRRAAINNGRKDQGITVAALRERHGDECPYCGRTMTFASENRKYVPERATIEHVVPISEGGEHTWRNVVLACWRCNLSKNRRRLDDWSARPHRTPDLHAATT